MTTPELIVGAVVCVLLGAVLGRVALPARSSRLWAPTPALSAVPPQYGADAPVSGTPRVGDDVVLEGRPGTVRATIGFRGGGESWTTLLVGSEVGEAWVTLVEVAGALEVCRWSKLSELPGSASAGQIQHRGVTYTERERGTAVYEAHGDVDLPAVGEMRFVDHDSGEHRLSFENYDDAGWEASVGRVLPPGAFARRP